MVFSIYKPPETADDTWASLKIGDINDVVEWDYTRFFCGAGTFSMIIPRTSTFADKIEVGCFLITINGDGYDGFIVKNIRYENDTLKITGYDLNGMLVDRITVAKTDDGKDVQSGATETIVKHYVAVNCVKSEDAERNFPALEIAEDLARGNPNDAASPRLSRVSDIIADILGAAGMGYRIYPLFGKNTARFVFDVYEEVNRTDEQTENSRVIFAFGHGNITEMVRETGVTADRNTFYCELSDGLVTRYDKKISGAGDEETTETPAFSGYNRREEFLELNCELAELEVYAEHEIADRYLETDALEIVAGNPLDYGAVYNVGDIATVYDRRRDVKLNSVISAAEVKRTANEYSVKITLGNAKPKPLDLLSKSNGAVSTVIRQSVEVKPLINDYEYVSDTSVRFNGITYNVEKDGETGLISKISDNYNHELSPTINSGINDVALHNAVFWASAMLSGFGKIQQRTLYDGLNGSWTFSGGFSGFTKITTVEQHYSGADNIAYTSGVKVIRLSKSYCIDDELDNHTDTIVLRSNEQINLTGYKTLRVLAVAFKNYSTLTGSVYFKWGGASGAVRQEQYDFSGWANVTSCDIISTDYNAPGAAQWYDIDVSAVNGNQYLNFAVYHGPQTSEYTAYFDVQKIILLP